MSKRPKLSLSPDRMVEKKQALGFKDTALGQPKAAQAATQPSSEKRQSPSPGKAAVSATQQDGAWNRAKVVKVVLAIAIASLSLLLLKRRLM